MAQSHSTDREVHILRRRLPANASAHRLLTTAAEGLRQAAPLTAAIAEANDNPPLPPRWVQIVNADVGRLLTYLDQLKGKSDANRYRLRGANYEQAVDAFMTALFNKLCEVDDAFRHKLGTKEKFDLNAAIQGGHESGTTNEGVDKT